MLPQRSMTRLETAVFVNSVSRGREGCGLPRVSPARIP
jgi:hypothetical protein